MISTTQLQAVFTHAGERLATFVQPLNETMVRFAISTPLRQAAFLAQIAHESGELQYLRELADGSAYEGRLDLGNTEPGDGMRFPGRGLLQVTGRLNYERCGTMLNLPLLQHPELLEIPQNAALSAGWFWAGHGLNTLADQNAFAAITRAINGGYHGMDERIRYWLRAREALGATTL